MLSTDIEQRESNIVLCRKEKFSFIFLLNFLQSADERKTMTNKSNQGTYKWQEFLWSESGEIAFNDNYGKRHVVPVAKPIWKFGVCSKIYINLIELPVSPDRSSLKLRVYVKTNPYLSVRFVDNLFHLRLWGRESTANNLHVVTLKKYICSGRIVASLLLADVLKSALFKLFYVTAH